MNSFSYDKAMSKIFDYSSSSSSPNNTRPEMLPNYTSPDRQRLQTRFRFYAIRVLLLLYCIGQQLQC